MGRRIQRLMSIFKSRYRRLLHQIETAQRNHQRVALQNGVVLDFRPGHEYDDCRSYEFPCEHYDEDFVQMYGTRIGQVVRIDVYDCFGGAVKILAVGANRIFIEVIDVAACYGCCQPPRRGEKFWVGRWDLCAGSTNTSSPVKGFENSDLPF